MDTVSRLSYILFLSILLLTGCTGNGGGSEATDETTPTDTDEVSNINVVDSSGGTVTSLDKQASLYVPPGAVAQETAFSIEPDKDITPVVGKAYRFGPAGSTFAVPVTISIYYDDADLPQGVGEDSLVLGKWLTDHWQPVIGSVVDMVEHKVLGDTLSFSSYGIMQANPPGPINDPPVATDGTLSIQSGGTNTGILVATDADGDALTYSVVSNGIKGTATVTDPDTGAFSYTAQAGAVGSDSFTFKANDGTDDSNIATIDVNISAAPVLHQLTIQKSSWGSGIILDSSPGTSDISCGNTCSDLFEAGTEVILVLAPLPGTVYVTEWRGCDSYTSTTCTVTMDYNRVVQADLDAPITNWTHQDDVDGDYTYRWTCKYPQYCTTGQYLIQEDTSDEFPSPVQYTRNYPANTFAGSFVTLDRSDDLYCYRVRPTTLLNWSQPACTRVDRVQRDSINFYAEEGNGDSYPSEPSAYGRYVVFSSTADNLVSQDTEGVRDVFYRDTKFGSIRRVSENSTTSGDGGNGDSYAAKVTADGQHVVFYSHANNLVSNDNNGTADYFVWDYATRDIERVSVTSSETEVNGGSNSAQLDITADGNKIVFATDMDLSGEGDAYINDVYLRDRATGTTTLISSGPLGGNTYQTSQSPAITPNGRYVVFESDVSSLVGGDNNNARDIFRKDLKTGSYAIVSTASNGVQGNASSYSPAISSDGRYISFTSYANNLITNDNNGFSDVFVKDMVTGEVKRASQRINLVSGTKYIIEGNGHSRSESISANGLSVVFSSAADNLITYDNNSNDDIFVVYMPTESITHVSRRNSLIYANDYSGGGYISEDGMVIGFVSAADNISYEDNNESLDTFLYSLKTSGMAPGLEDEDDDGDGLDNWTELTSTYTLHFNPDSDGDGYNDKAESDAGSDPWDPASTP